MSTINEILDTLEQEVNDGIKVTKRLQQKTFGLFKNPIFLLTFFTIIFFVIGYKIYHHYKREDDTRCSVYNDPEKCPKYCVWDTEELSCSPKLKGKDQRGCFIEILTQVIRKSPRLHLD